MAGSYFVIPGARSSGVRGMLSRGHATQAYRATVRMSLCRSPYSWNDTFEYLGARTKVATTHSSTRHERDGFSSSGMERGDRNAMIRLADCSQRGIAESQSRGRASAFIEAWSSARAATLSVDPRPPRASRELALARESPPPGVLRAMRIASRSGAMRLGE